MFSKRILAVFLFVCFLVVPLLLSVPGFSQDNYTFVLKWGGIGSGPSQFNNPLAIAVDSQNNIYVTDAGNERIQKFDKNGNFIKQWGMEGTEDGQFRHPMGIAVDKNDNVYVVDTLNCRVQKFTSDGTFILKWGRAEYPNQFDEAMWYPNGVACDSDNNVYVVAAIYGDIPPYNNAIKKFSSTGVFLGKFGNVGPRDWLQDDSDPYNCVNPQYIAVNSRGEIYVSFWAGGIFPFQIKKFDSSFIFIKRVLLDAVTGIAIDSDNNVFACSIRDWNMGVYKYDADLNNRQMIIFPDYSSEQITGVNRPQAIAIDHDGNVYIVENSNYQYFIKKFSPPLKKYTFDGFLSPIENSPVVNQAKAGQAIPVKWRILDKNSLPISDPASFKSITSYGVDCAAFAGDPTSSVEEVAAGSSGLQYIGNGWWQFNWKTPKSYKAQCRVMKLTLDDKSEHTASFSFK